MKIIKTSIFIMLFSCINLQAVYDGYWRFTQEVSLKKEQYYSTSLSRDQAKKDLHIKWTLYVNDLLTMQVNLDKFNHQFNLKLSHKLDAFRIPLFTKQDMEVERPYLIIKFLKYDKKKKSADFKLWIRNPSNDIGVKGKNI